MTTTRGPAQELRETIDLLPLEVRQAVLDGINSQRIIAGRHADGMGGLCPMEAAEVPWKSTSRSSVKQAQAAARAWDRYAGVTPSSWRPATKRQLLALRSMLEASILEETARTEMPLCDVIAEYESARSRRAGDPAPMERFTTPAVAPMARPSAPAEVPVARPSTPAEAPMARPSTPAQPPTARPSTTRRRDTGERDRTRELSEREGWSWLRPFRNYDEYEEALLQAMAQIGDYAPQPGEPVAR